MTRETGHVFDTEITERLMRLHSDSIGPAVDSRVAWKTFTDAVNEEAVKAGFPLKYDSAGSLISYGVSTSGKLLEWVP